jgi:hypothetical protein
VLEEDDKEHSVPLGANEYRARRGNTVVGPSGRNEKGPDMEKRRASEREGVRRIFSVLNFFFKSILFANWFENI